MPDQFCVDVVASGVANIQFSIGKLPQQTVTLSKARALVVLSSLPIHRRHISRASLQVFSLADSQNDQALIDSAVWQWDGHVRCGD